MRVRVRVNGEPGGAMPFPAALLALVAGILALGCSGDTSTALGAAEDCWNPENCIHPDCLGHVACEAAIELDCANGVDDDGDGLADCMDPDCKPMQACQPDREVVCDDGRDNDGDGLIDCDDPDCLESGLTGPCNEDCSDGIDNDGDELVDCNDPDCYANAHCGGPSENCTNQVDDDGDELIDCDDPDCALEPECEGGLPPPEICDNRTDDDGDGLIDCADPDCVTNPHCREIVCNDGLDDDGDGLVDCADTQDCGQAPACQPDTTCSRHTLLSCDDTVTGSTVGAHSTFSTYGCSDVPLLEGGEDFYVLSSSMLGTVTLVISSQNTAADLHILAIEGDANGCLPNGWCLSSSADGSITVDLSNLRHDVYIVVDSAQQAGADYALSVQCGEICTNGIDDDGDGMIDCYDPDCDCWTSGGTACIDINGCQGSEICFVLPGTNLDQGVCTQACFSDDDCYNETYTTGKCEFFGMDSFCVMECGSNLGDPPCPTSTQCTDSTGNTIGVTLGICTPYY